MSFSSTLHPDIAHLRAVPSHIERAIADELAARAIDGRMKLIGEGLFAEVYREDPAADRVYVVTKGAGVHDKQIAVDAHAANPNNHHLPAVEHVGKTSDDRDVFTMPYYRTPLRRTSEDAWSDYKRLSGCHGAAYLDVAESEADPWRAYPLINRATVACARRASRRSPITPAVAEALGELITAAEPYGQYALEFDPRNLATDSAGHLILLDVLYDPYEAERRRG